MSDRPDAPSVPYVYPKTVDIRVEDLGTVTAITLRTDEAKEWADINLELEGWQWLGDRSTGRPWQFAVESRYAQAIVAGAVMDGLEVSL